MNSIPVSIAPHLYHWFVRPSWFTKRYIHQPIQEHFGDLKDKKILDFGSGTGANSRMFRFTDYIGVDPDKERIEFAKNLYPDYTFEVFDTKKIPVESKSIDYIAIIAVLHHIDTEQIKAYLDEFKRILKKDGKLMIMEPYICKDHPICNRFMNWYDNGVYLRSEAEYLQLFDGEFDCKVLKRFRKCLLYNELFFTALPKLSPR